MPARSSNASAFPSLSAADLLSCGTASVRGPSGRASDPHRAWFGAACCPTRAASLGALVRSVSACRSRPPPCWVEPLPPKTTGCQPPQRIASSRSSINPRVRSRLIGPCGLRLRPRPVPTTSTLESPCRWAAGLAPKSVVGCTSYAHGSSFVATSFLAT